MKKGTMKKNPMEVQDVSSAKRQLAGLKHCPASLPQLSISATWAELKGAPDAARSTLPHPAQLHQQPDPPSLQQAGFTLTSAWQVSSQLSGDDFSSEAPSSRTLHQCYSVKQQGL